MGALAMVIVSSMQKVLMDVTIGSALLLLSAVPPAHASCFVNSWCSNSYDKNYNSSNCRYQRDSCDNQSSTTPSAPSRSYGAIAYSTSSGDYGYSEQYSNRAQAERRAKQECGQKDCEVAAWFFNGCGAVAADGDGAWGGAQGNDEPRARQAAQARCKREGGRNCQIVFSRCSR